MLITNIWKNKFAFACISEQCIIFRAGSSHDGLVATNKVNSIMTKIEHECYHARNSVVLPITYASISFWQKQKQNSCSVLLSYFSRFNSIIFYYKSKWYYLQFIKYRTRTLESHLKINTHLLYPIIYWNNFFLCYWFTKSFMDIVQKKSYLGKPGWKFQWRLLESLHLQLLKFLTELTWI